MRSRSFGRECVIENPGFPIYLDLIVISVILIIAFHGFAIGTIMAFTHSKKEGVIVCSVLLLLAVIIHLLITESPGEISFHSVLLAFFLLNIPAYIYMRIRKPFFRGSVSSSGGSSGIGGGFSGGGSFGGGGASGSW